MPSSALDISVVSQGPRTVLAAAGDLDMETAPELEAAVAREADESARLILDLSGVHFIDSSGLRGLLRLRQRSGGLGLAAPSATVRRLLDLTNLADAFFVEAPVEGSE